MEVSTEYIFSITCLVITLITVAVLFISVLVKKNGCCGNPKKGPLFQKFEEKEFSIFTGTWNVNGKDPPTSDELAKWLQIENGNKKFDASDPEIFAIGFQEIVPLTISGSLLWLSPCSTKSEDQTNKWVDDIESVLRLKLNTAYVAKYIKNMYGITLIIFVKSENEDKFDEMSTDCVKTGFKGYLGNKGGVAISFRFADNDFCFIACHLSSGIGNLKKRNKDFANICKQLLFHKSSAFPKTYENHDHVILLGDLNYHIDANMGKIFKDKISDHKDCEIIGDLFQKFDQLREELERGSLSEFGFYEEKISFDPTYRMVIGSKYFQYDIKRWLA